MALKAKKKGFYAGVLRNEGDVFALHEVHGVPSWAEEVDDAELSPEEVLKQSEFARLAEEASKANEGRHQTPLHEDRPKRGRTRGGSDGADLV